MNSIILKLLSPDLWPSMWSVLEKGPWALGKLLGGVVRVRLGHVVCSGAWVCFFLRFPVCPSLQMGSESVSTITSSSAVYFFLQVCRCLYIYTCHTFWLNWSIFKLCNDFLCPCDTVWPKVHFDVSVYILFSLGYIPSLLTYVSWNLKQVSYVRHVAGS